MPTCTIPVREAELSTASLVEPADATMAAAEDLAFERAAILLPWVGRELEALLLVGELETALAHTRRAQRALVVQDARLRQALRDRLPELAAGVGLPEAVPRASELVDHVREFVLHHYHRPMGLTEAAASVRRSAAYISTLFVRETGITFHAYLMELRMSRAEKLLHEPAALVNEVACAVGYASEDAFRHAFRKHTGFSPSEWRELPSSPAATVKPDVV